MMNGGNGAANWVRLNGVSAPTAGTYPVTVWAAVSGTRSLFVSVNGGAGVVTAVDGRVVSVLAATVREGRIVAIDILADRDRLAPLAPPA